MDYPSTAKGGFFVGLAVFVLGEGGELLAHASLEPIPSWENALCFTLAVVGLLVGFVSPILFGIVVPLTE